MERKISEYQLVRCGDSGTFGMIIHDRIKEGWQPFGGPYLSEIVYLIESDGKQVETCRSEYGQAMVKYAD